MIRQTNSRTALLKIAFVSMITLGFGLQAVVAKPPHKGSSIKGRYAFRMAPIKSFSADAPGDPAGVAGAPRQDVLRIGVFTADENGNLTGHTVATTDTNQGHTWIIVFDWAGKYVVNADGTGFFSVDSVSNMACTDTTVAHSGATPHPAAGGGTPFMGNVPCPTGDASPEGHEDYAFVFSTPGGKRIEFIQTDNAGSGAKIFMTGAATRQEDNGEGGDN